MLTVPHALTGAAIGIIIQDVPAAPIVAFGLGWASHYLLDMVPHWERMYRPHEEINWGTDQPAKDWPRHIFIQAVIDVLVAITLIWFLFYETQPPNSAMLWGALGGTFPDLLGNVPFWNRMLVRWPFFKQEKKFHETVHISPESQKSSPRFSGFLTQLVIIVVSIFIILAA